MSSTDTRMHGHTCHAHTVNDINMAARDRSWMSYPDEDDTSRDDLSTHEPPESPALATSPQHEENQHITSHSQNRAAEEQRIAEFMRRKMEARRAEAAEHRDHSKDTKPAVQRHETVKQKNSADGEKARGTPDIGAEFVMKKRREAADHDIRLCTYVCMHLCMNIYTPSLSEC